MDIGKESEPYVVEPIEDPFETPRRETAPALPLPALPTPTPVPEKVPA